MYAFISSRILLEEKPTLHTNAPGCVAQKFFIVFKFRRSTVLSQPVLVVSNEMQSYPQLQHILMPINAAKIEVHAPKAPKP